MESKLHDMIFKGSWSLNIQKCLPEILQTKPHQAISWDRKTMNLYINLSSFMKKFYIIACSCLSGKDIVNIVPSYFFIH